ncbi:hypothetical protein ACH4TY_03375 [Streptomyces anulatus]
MKKQPMAEMHPMIPGSPHPPLFPEAIRKTEKAIPATANAAANWTYRLTAARRSIVHPTCDSDIFIPSVCPGVRAEASLGHGVTLFSPGLGRVYADALPAVRCFYFARFRAYKKAMTVPNAMNAPMVR